VFPNISLSEQQWEVLYGDNYFSNTTSWWARRRCRDRKQRLDWLVEYSERKIDRFLDIGCGEGLTLVEARQRGWDVYGVDISDNRLDIAKDTKIEFHKANILQTTFPHNFFDCIYMDSVLEHVTDPCRYLNEVSRILREDGIVYIALPNEDCLFNDVKRLLFMLLGKRNQSAKLQPFKRPYHVIGFTRKSLFEVVHRSGFKILRFRNFAGEYEWRKFRCFTRPFVINLFLLPVHLAAIPLRRRTYMDAIVRKVKHK
jgi:ubiquinone/menaquinone biosynthesis C-methylase UbiE